MESRVINLRLINRKIQNLRHEYGEYDDYYRDQKKNYTNQVDDNLINVNIQLNYKEKKLIELVDITKDISIKTNALHEKLIDNGQRLQEIHQNKSELNTEVDRAEQDVIFLNRREMMKKYLLVGLIVVLGLLDFIILICKIRGMFRS